MLFTLAAVVLSTSIAVFFSKEFAGVYRKIIAVPGAKLLLPLIIASWLIETYEPFELWFLLKCKEGFHYLLFQLSALTTLNQNSAQIIQLFILATFPFLVLRALELRRKKPVPGLITSRIGLIIWVIAATVLTIHRP